MSQHTIDRMLRDRARITPDRVAIVERDRALDVRRARRALRRARRRARATATRVSTLTGNSGEHVALMFACAKAGAILHPISWRLAPAEVALPARRRRAGLLPRRRRAPRSWPKPRSRWRTVAPARELESAARNLVRAPGADDPLLLIYTSGTTGKPKGALLTHANCFWTNLSFDLATGIRPDDVVLQVLPQFHCGGWNVQSILAWWKGATVVLERGFDAARALDADRARAGDDDDGRAGELPVHGAGAAASPTADLSSLRLAVVGGAPMPEALLDDVGGPRRRRSSRATA